MKLLIRSFHPLIFVSILGIVMLMLCGLIDLLWGIAGTELGDDSIWLKHDWERMSYGAMWIFFFSVGTFGFVINFLKAIRLHVQPVKDFTDMNECTSQECRKIHLWLDTGEAQTTDIQFMMREMP